MLYEPKTPDAVHSDEVVTERTKQRDAEEQEFVPVIFKRTDESRRHPDDMLEHIRGTQKDI
jgi:hypothetical protein